MTDRGSEMSATLSVQERVAERIQEARQQARGGKGFTQQELAEKLGISPVTLSRWETGRRSPSFDDLERFGKVVGVPISFFFEEEPREDDFDKQLLRATRELSEEDKEEILAYVNFKYRRWYERHNR